MGKQFIQVSNDFDDPKFHGLSSNALLLYGRFYSLADLKKKTPAYASNKYLSEKTGWSERTVSRVVDELEDWNLITTNCVKHGLTKTTRYVMPLSLEGASNPKQLTSSAKAVDTNVVAVDINVEAVDKNCSKQLTPVSTIIDNKINNTINNIIVTTFDVDEDLLDRINFDWKGYSIKEESINTLSPVEQKKLFNWLEENLHSKPKPSIKTVIESKLWKGNAYNKWIKNNKPKPIVTPYEDMMGEARL